MRYISEYIRKLNRVMIGFFCLCMLLPVSPVHAATTSNSTKISVATLTNGTITPNKTTATAGSTVTFTVTPAAGYKVKAGTLKYTYDYFDTNAETSKSKTVVLDDTATSLTIPSRVKFTEYVPDTCYEEPDCTPGEETCKLNISCANKCAGMYDNCIDMCTECTPGPDVCTGGGPYDCSYYETIYYYTSGITITAEFELDVAPYMINYYQEQLNGIYQLIASETKQGTINSSVNASKVNTFTGFSLAKLVNGR